MPIYEFKCLKCGAPAEVLQRVGDRAPACPGCGSRRMRRAVSKTSFQLKGGGWYADLYATPRPGATKAEGADGAKGAVEKPAAKPEEGAKPATASTTSPAAAPSSAPAASPGPKAEPASGEVRRERRGHPSGARKRR